ncbi:MAG: nucleoside 2-deoxyribosyltransferase [Anaerolineaceae bacterium]|nr:nucleoside 2-deoxyribosyltransferase [Anaerolineaceae bacterium]
MYAYIAGPLFNEGERWFDEQINAVAEDAGFETFLPHRDQAPDSGDSFDPEAIFHWDVQNLERAELVIANLNGVTSDDGTAWELGYAYARGKHLVGVYTDMRLTFDDQVVNLMLQFSLNRLVRSLAELEDYLQGHAREQGLRPR